MATTRNLKQIDEALQRPGRMDRIFHLQRPTQAERENILYSAAKETMDDQLVEYVDWKKVYPKFSIFNRNIMFFNSNMKSSTLGITRYPAKQKSEIQQRTRKILNAARVPSHCIFIGNGDSTYQLSKVPKRSNE